MSFERLISTSQRHPLSLNFLRGVNYFCTLYRVLCTKYSVISPVVDRKFLLQFGALGQEAQKKREIKFDNHGAKLILKLTCFSEQILSDRYCTTSTATEDFVIISLPSNQTLKPRETGHQKDFIFRQKGRRSSHRSDWQTSTDSLPIIIDTDEGTGSFP